MTEAKRMKRLFCRIYLQGAAGELLVSPQYSRLFTNWMLWRFFHSAVSIFFCLRLKYKSFQEQLWSATSSLWSKKPNFGKTFHWKCKLPMPKAESDGWASILPGVGVKWALLWPEFKMFWKLSSASYRLTNALGRDDSLFAQFFFISRDCSLKKLFRALTHAFQSYLMLAQ